MSEQTLTAYDMAWCLRRLPRKVRDLVRESLIRIILAGGFIRSCIANEEVNDVDLFVGSVSAALDVANALAPDQDRAKDKLACLPGVIATDNAYTITSLRPAVQVIHKWTFTNPVECIQSFDFTIARAAIWYDGAWKSVCDPNFYSDLAAKRLVYCSPVRIEQAGGSLLRVLKFYQRGYRIPLDSLAAVISRLSSAVDWTKCGDGKDEQQSAKVILGLLREVDPNIDPSHEAHLPAGSDTEATESQ